MSSPSEAIHRIAVFSDIHGNHQALQAVLKDIDEAGADRLSCLGDVVGYGAQPNERIETLRRREIPTLAGNHDHAAVGLTDITFFNAIAKAAVEWTRGALTDEHSEWLKALPYTSRIEPDLFFVHASPKDPEAWNYVLTFGEARQAFECFTEKFCFIGHSHQPAIVQKRADELFCPEGHEIGIDDNSRYLINVGSVGQPRDRNPAACYVMLDLDKQKIEFRRVNYEIDMAQSAIRESGLPEELAERLRYGW